MKRQRHLFLVVMAVAAALAFVAPSKDARQDVRSIPPGPYIIAMR